MQDVFPLPTGECTCETLETLITQNEGALVIGGFLYRLNNPGGLVYAAQRDAYGVIGTDGIVWAGFPTAEAGYRALSVQIRRAFRKNPTIHQFAFSYQGASYPEGAPLPYERLMIERYHATSETRLQEILKPMPTKQTKLQDMKEIGIIYAVLLPTAVMYLTRRWSANLWRKIKSYGKARAFRREWKKFYYIENTDCKAAIISFHDQYDAIPIPPNGGWIHPFGEEWPRKRKVFYAEGDALHVETETYLEVRAPGRYYVEIPGRAAVTLTLPDYSIRTGECFGGSEPRQPANSFRSL